MKLGNIWTEVSEMLYWTMLAACTVGPGTVVTCARAGAEYDLHLIWALVFASILAYTLQEGTARLTIVSGLSLGQCLRVKYRHGAKIYDSAVICWLVGVSVFFGNTLYECNNWAGGIDAILAIPGSENTTTLRVCCCVGYMLAVLALLYWDKTDMLGMFLGCMMMGMVALFLEVVAFMGFDVKGFAYGLIPNIPEKKFAHSAEPADIILSLVGTTSLGFNLFLGGSMAKGKKLESSQRGIMFSTVSALEVSILILIVGAGTFDEPTHGGGFSISILSGLIQQYIGEIGVVVFAVGFVAAALSSMLAVPLGAGLTVESVFSECDEERVGEWESVNKEADDDWNPAIERPILKVTQETENSRLMAGEETSADDKATDKAADTKDEAAVPLNNKTGTVEDMEEGSVVVRRANRQLPRPVYWAIISSMVLISTVVISLNAPRVHVILVAQVFNGCLLPFFAICLLLCLNDQQFMSSSPQSTWANCFLFTSVTITMFLASNVFLGKMFGAFFNLGVYLQMGLAAGAACVGMLAICLFTSLGSDLVLSHTEWRAKRATAA